MGSTAASRETSAAGEGAGTAADVAPNGEKDALCQTPATSGAQTPSSKMGSQQNTTDPRLRWARWTLILASCLALLAILALASLVLILVSEAEADEAAPQALLVHGAANRTSTRLPPPLSNATAGVANKTTTAKPHPSVTSTPSTSTTTQLPLKVLQKGKKNDHKGGPKALVSGVLEINAKGVTPAQLEAAVANTLAVYFGVTLDVLAVDAIKASYDHAIRRLAAQFSSKSLWSVYYQASLPKASVPKKGPIIPDKDAESFGEELLGQLIDGGAKEKVLAASFKLAGFASSCSCQCDWADKSTACLIDDGSCCWRPCCRRPCECSWASKPGACTTKDESRCWEACCESARS